MSRPTARIASRPSRRERAAWIAGLTAALWLVALTPAHAYIDPGTTTMIFSAVVAFLAAAGMTVRIAWRRILRFFGREPDPSPVTDDVAEPQREHQPGRS